MYGNFSWNINKFKFQISNLKIKYKIHRYNNFLLLSENIFHVELKVYFRLFQLAMKFVHESLFPRKNIRCI